MKQPCPVVAEQLQPPSVQCVGHRAASEKSRVRPRTQHPGTVSGPAWVHEVPESLSLHPPPLSPKTCWVQHSLTPHPGISCSLARTHTKQRSLILGCQASALLCFWFTLVRLLLCPGRFEPLAQTKTLFPPPPNIALPFTVQVQCSTATAPCILSRPRSIRPLLLSLPPHSPTPLFSQRRFLPFACRPAVVALTNFSRFFSSRFSPPALSLRRPPTCLAVPFSFPLSQLTDPSFSANGGKHLSKILQQ